MIGHELGVLTKAVVRALDLNDNGVVQQPIHERGGDDRIAEDIAPFCKAAI